MNEARYTDAHICYICGVGGISKTPDSCKSSSTVLLLVSRDKYARIHGAYHSQVISSHGHNRYCTVLRHITPVMSLSIVNKAWRTNCCHEWSASSGVILEISLRSSLNNYMLYTSSNFMDGPSQSRPNRIRTPERSPGQPVLPIKHSSHAYEDDWQYKSPRRAFREYNRKYFRALIIGRYWYEFCRAQKYQAIEASPILSFPPEQLSNSIGHNSQGTFCSGLASS